MRARLITNGIHDPMALPSMHVLLDFTESVMVESIGSSGKNANDSEQKVSNFYDSLYAPEVGDLKVNGDGYKPMPAGFEDENVEASFDAFMQASGR